jgi:hypothetical protein
LDVGELNSLLIGPGGKDHGKKESAIRAKESASLASLSSWPDVPAGAVLLSPAKCRDSWRLFETEAEVYIAQAAANQEAAKRANQSGEKTTIFVLQNISLS